MTLSEDHKTGDTYIPIATEEIYLVIPGSHPLSSLAPKNGHAALTSQLSKMNHLC